MRSGKEIRGKIRSIKNTQKITRAMEMVAASKMRRAQQRMARARPYSEKIREMCAHIERGNLEYRHPYATARPEVGTIGVVVITTDKGLCGGLNANTLRKVSAQSMEWERRGHKMRYTVFGNKGVSFMSRIGFKIVSQTSGLGDAPELDPLIGPVSAMTSAYLDKEVDEIWLAYARFVNTIKQDAVLEQLLPLDPNYNVDADAHSIATRQHSWDYIYEPGAVVILDALMRRYIESVIYQAVVDNAASEQAARMVAMKSASENAGNLIDELQLVYNKSRQASITTELSEIIGGAAAV